MLAAPDLATGRSITGSGIASLAVPGRRPVGSAHKNGKYHRAASFVVDGIASKGSVFGIVGKDGVKRVLIQSPGNVNGFAGRFEWIVHDGKLTHRMFVKGAPSTGFRSSP